ncbi:nucleotide sugar dehydrogenase [Pelagibacteraceae bacterium]|jgi:UDPglucose 6-dehydrogenase|nr:nucleotide sugar dehydrogenase [Pelagibacteraceae bacterium]
MKITVVGTGYVGLSLAVLLSKKNEVVALDIDKERVALINKRISPILDTKISKILSERKNKICATLNKEVAYKKSAITIICTPTDYNPITNKFDTSSILKVIKEILSINTKTIILIKSTLPIGYTKFLIKKFSYKKIIFSPEFLREGQSISDNINPSRIIIGDNSSNGKKIADLFLSLTSTKKIPILFMSSNEAEAIKLFSNTYLALRVSFFNEVDSYCEVNNFSSLNIINGICLDPRIGNYYNNPSFGYGGYCLPKDTKQLLSNFKNIPNDIIKSTVKANNTRKKFIANNIIGKKPKIIGVYKLAMKKDSDNFRQSAIIDVLKIIKRTSKKIKIIVFDKNINKNNIFGYKLENDLKTFKETADLIISNRKYKELIDIKNKLYTRDLFEIN